MCFGMGHCIQPGCPALVWSFALGHIIVYSRGVPPLCGPLHWDIVYSRGAPALLLSFGLDHIVVNSRSVWSLDWDTSLYTAGCVVLWIGTHCIQPGVWSFGFGHIIVYSRCVWSFGLGHIIVYSRVYSPLDWDTSLYIAGCVAFWTGTHHCIQPGVVAFWTGTHHCIQPGVVAFWTGTHHCTQPVCPGLWTGTPSGYSHTWAMPQNNASR